MITSGRLVFSKAGLGVLEDTFYIGNHVRLSSATVEVDRQSDTRRTMSCELVITDDIGRELVDPVFKAEIAAYLGFSEDGEVWDWRPQGVFHASRRGLSANANLATASLNCMDRSDILRNNPFSTAYVVADLTNYLTAIQTLITNRADGFTPEYNHVIFTTYTTPGLVYEEDEDPWSAVLKLAEALGGETYFDVNGIHVVKFIPTLAQLPTKAFVSPSGGDVTVGETTLSTDISEIYNGVVCRSEAPWLLFPVHGEVWDNDPASPTYMPTWGKKPKKITDAVASTTAQCQAIAQAEFNKVAGVLEDITFGLDPSTEIFEGDAVQVYDASLGISSRALVDKLTIPLGGSDEVSGMIRRRR